MYAVSPDGSWRAIGSESDLLPTETLSMTEPSPSFGDVVATVEAGVQTWMDSVAQQNGYDNVMSCATYATSTVAPWKADADAIVAWRDAVWQAAYNWQQSLNGSVPSIMPTLEQVIAQLPQPADFGWIVHAPGATS